MQKDQQKLAELIQGKKVAFIGAGVSHKTLIKEFVELGAHVTLCDQKKSVEEFGDYAATSREPILINTAREGIVRHGALDSALQSGRLAGFAIDDAPLTAFGAAAEPLRAAPAAFGTEE